MTVLNDFFPTVGWRRWRARDKRGSKKVSKERRKTKVGRTGDGGGIEGMKEGEVATRVKSSRGVAEARKEHASYRLVFPLTAYFR